MSRITVEKKSPSTLRLIPSAEQQAAVGALVGCAICLGVIGVLMDGITLVRFAVLYLCFIFLTVGMILRRQQRIVEISMEDGCVYFLGKCKTDVYSIPFGMITALRLTRRNVQGGLLAYGDAARKGSYSRYPFHLDVMLRDSGYETLDRSVLGPDLAAIALEIAKMTGFAIEDQADVGFSRSARINYSPGIPGLEKDASEHPALKAFSLDGKKGFAWSLSPGGLYVLLMFFATIGLVYGGGYGAVKGIWGDGNAWAGSVLLVACIFFASVICYRLIRAFGGKGFVVWDDETVRFGTLFFGREYSSVLLELRDVKIIRSVIPRVGEGFLEVVQKSGTVFKMLDVVSPLASLTTGDLHWLSRYIRQQTSVTAFL